MKLIQKIRNASAIPVSVTLKQFYEFIFKYLPKRKRGPEYSIPSFKIFNYILKVIYTGCQWKELPIDLNEHGRPEIHYSRIFRIFQHWLRNGVFAKVFEGSVIFLHNNGLLDMSVLHGDGTTTAAKKGGDNIGFSGHKRVKGEKTVIFVDRNCNVISPFTTSSGNTHETTLFDDAFTHFKRVLKLVGKSYTDIIASLDSAYDSFANRKKIFNAGMIPNIKENPRNRKKSKKGRKRIYEESIFQERFNTVERVFAWEDKFKRLLLRLERISTHHSAMKLIAYTMINLRHMTI